MKLAISFTYPASSSLSRTSKAVPDDGPGDGRGGVRGRPRPRTWRWIRRGRYRTRRPRRPRPRTSGGPWPCYTTGRPLTRWDRTGTRRASSDRTRPGRRSPWPRGPCSMRPRCRSDRQSWLGSGTNSPWRSGATSLSRTVISSDGARVRYIRNKINTS